MPTWFITYAYLVPGWAQIRYDHVVIQAKSPVHWLARANTNSLGPDVLVSKPLYIVYAQQLATLEEVETAKSVL